VIFEKLEIEQRFYKPLRLFFGAIRATSKQPDLANDIQQRCDY
jgi:hypothetical protein